MSTSVPNDQPPRILDLSSVDLSALVEGTSHQDSSVREPVATTPTLTDLVLPDHLGRYRVLGQLGTGSFGIVFKAHDRDLQRDVAIKVPHRRRIASAEDIDAYLAEARILAGLDHPGIVPVYDLGRSADGLCYLVSKFIEGGDLAGRLRQSRTVPAEAAALVVRVAEALHHAHQRGLIHRDIKPANILLDMSGNPWVADFGLALREEDWSSDRISAGTPAYMSPEQVRGEGHRVDPRTDIYSLGTVLYELLTGRQPFSADSRADLFERILRHPPCPPRQLDESIPAELERICLKCLAKRMSERYANMLDLAGDLRNWSVPPASATRTAKGQVFISYASADRETALQLCQLLEAKTLGCWIAPRDVKAGEDYGEAIVRAIEAAEVVVILLSGSAQNSIHVQHEVERAASKRKRLIPVRLQDIRPSGALELHLSAVQWVDAWSSPLESVAVQLSTALRATAAPATTATPATQVAIPSSRVLAAWGAGKVVPRGLRCFDASDAEFFLDLLPGPRDRDGLPESIRFWKSRIEATDLEDAFGVGLLYGPSGCGKSSLVKAGLLPRVAEHVIPVYVESTADTTETRLLEALRKRCPNLPPELGLVDTLAALRRGRGLPQGKKILLVFDQFEQWLHARCNERETELVQALRHCDGRQVQCLVLVRDDFWMATTRFMQELEVRLVEGRNCAAVDLFDLSHAVKVLALFGAAFGRLPEKLTDLSMDQKRFLSQAVAGLAQEGKVISVRLALFADMVKGKPWLPATLKEIGGAEGVGVTFLQETFGEKTAPMPYRPYVRAAAAVLKALLPEQTTDIKGHMRSRDELMIAAGFAHHPRDFDALLRILDADLHLVTPTDPQGADRDNTDSASSLPGAGYYQLTHDYLVPALRLWLTRKQRETWQGRAELRLAERAALWNAQPSNRHLPAWWEGMLIRLGTRRRDWSESQARMMRKAAQYHGIRGLILLLLLAFTAVAAIRVRSIVIQEKAISHSRDLVERLKDAEVEQIPGIVRDMDDYRQWTDPQLRALLEQRDSPKQILHARLALLPVDAEQAQELCELLLDGKPQEVEVIRDTLLPHRDRLLNYLWQVLQDTQAARKRRFRAACALAAFDPANRQWRQVNQHVAEMLVAENPVYLGQWLPLLRPLRLQLLSALGHVFRDSTRPAERNMATRILVEYAADQPDILGELLKDADDQQFAILWPRIETYREKILLSLLRELDRTAAPDSSESEKETLAKRQAQSAVALLKLQHGERVWPLFQHRPDPRVRSWLIHRLAPLGADPQILIRRLDEENDVSAQRALLLSLGEYAPSALPSDVREPLVTRLQRRYRSDPDSGIHSAIDWLLSQRWGAGDELRKIEAAWEKAQNGQHSGEKRTRPHQWYHTKEGHTMVVIRHPEPFFMGSPENEPGHRPDEILHQQRIDRTFAIAAKKVTRRQFQRLVKGETTNAALKKYSPDDDAPITHVTWFDAIRYCRLLSEEEGIPETEMCYPPIKDIREGMTLPKNFLERKGYRLPTEAEWEYACRAGATTSHTYGSCEELLGRYAWYLPTAHDHTWPVGMLKPNDLGLFDVHGNSWDWCHNRYLQYESTSEDIIQEDREDAKTRVDNDPRVLRGGAFPYPAPLMRAAYRLWYGPSYRSLNVGFRVVQTVR